MNTKCGFCMRPITGNDWKRRVEYRYAESQTGGVLLYGPGMPGGPVEEAHGPLMQVLHYKCHYAAESRAKLDAAKADDPTFQPREPPDWREQECIDVGELTGEGDGNH